MFVRMDEGAIAKIEALHPFVLYTLLDNIQHTLCMHTVVSRANLTSWSVQTVMGSAAVNLEVSSCNTNTLHGTTVR